MRQRKVLQSGLAEGSMQCNGDVHREGLVRIRYGLAKLDAEEEKLDAEEERVVGCKKRCNHWEPLCCQSRSLHTANEAQCPARKVSLL